MATSANDRPIAKRRFDFRGGAASDSGNMGLDVRHSSQSGYVAVAVLMMLFTCLLLPLMAMLYFDSLACQKKAEHAEAKIEKLIKKLEERK